MEQIAITTPFGRRPASFGHIAAQMALSGTLAKAAEAGSNHPAAVNKWQLFRTLTAAREKLGLSDRTLALLNALLSFHPETALTLPSPEDLSPEAPSSAATDLVVFPSNRELSLRAHGMAEKTIRRHLAALVDAGLLIRRDSPNGKRYARRAADGAERFSEAFGFDLTPLVARAPELETLAEEVRREVRALAVLRERVTLARRDLGKLIAMGLEERLAGDWAGFRQAFLDLARPFRRAADQMSLEVALADARELRRRVDEALAVVFNSQDMTGNDDPNDRLQSNSNTQWDSDLEPASKEEGSVLSAGVFETKMAQPQQDISQDSAEQTLADPIGDLPLGLVLEACPDVREYAGDAPVRSWPDFVSAARTIRPMLGVSPDAWREAVEAMGERAAAVAVAVILQRSEHSSEAEMRTGPDGRQLTAVNSSPAIRSPGGYLRALTEKARAGGFTLGPVLMATIGQRLKAKRAGRASS